MRSLSVVDRLEFDTCIGNVMPDAVCVADVDNDGVDEVCVGNTEGAVFVFKSSSSRPWCQWSCAASDEGSSEMVSCLTVGDVCNKNKNFLVVLSTAGWIHVFDLNGDAVPKSRSSSVNRQALVRSSSNTMSPAGGKDPFSTPKDLSDSGSIAASSTAPDVKPFFSQRFSFNFNAKIVSVAQVTTPQYEDDVDFKLVIAYTDRVVRLFAWRDGPACVGAVASPLSGGVYSPFEELNFNMLAGNGGGAEDSSNTTQDSVTADKEPTTSRCSSFSGISAEQGAQGNFDLVFIWTLPGQIYSVSCLCPLPECGCEGRGCCGAESCCDGGAGQEKRCWCDRIFVSQPGGKFASLRAKEESSITVSVRKDEGKSTAKKSTEEKKSESENLRLDAQSTEPKPEDHFPLQGLVKLHAMNSKADRFKSDGVVTHIFSFRHFFPGDTSPVVVTVLTTIDGGVSVYVLQSHNHDKQGSTETERLLWSKHLDNQFYFLRSLNSFAPRSPPLFAASSWDGQTIVFNLEREMVKIRVEDSISAFVVGRLGFESPLFPLPPPDPNKLSFLFVTTNGKIVVLGIDFCFSRLSPTTLIEALESTPEGDDACRLIDELGLDAVNLQERKFRDFVHYVLYS